jgi:hypothetical protein
MKYLDVSCGNVYFSIKDLLIDTKINKKSKITSGLPHKSK